MTRQMPPTPRNLLFALIFMIGQSRINTINPSLPVSWQGLQVCTPSTAWCCWRPYVASLSRPSHANRVRRQAGSCETGG
ncbi:hypothetical protein BDV10DRAFT_157715 [Aspergillus recurvatus]